jgi:predicted nuclease of predicted toxin-antitoxin system
LRASAFHWARFVRYAMPVTMLVHLRELGLQRLPDDQILAKADREDRVLLTFDLDFADLLALGLLKSPSVMIFRLNDETPASVIPRMMAVIAERQRELEQGVVIMVEDTRYRLRRLPLNEDE